MDIKYNKDTSKTNGINLDVDVWYSNTELAPRNGDWFIFKGVNNWVDLAYFDKDRNGFFCTDVSDEANIDLFCLLPPINDVRCWNSIKLIHSLSSDEDVVLTINPKSNYLWRPYHLLHRDDNYKDWRIDLFHEDVKYEVYYELPVEYR